MGALGAIRSLGRAGYLVHAVAPSADAIGLRSKFAYRNLMHPAGDDPRFEEWAESYIRQNEIELIIPGGPISPASSGIFGNLKHLFAQTTDPTVLVRGRKYELFQTLLQASDIGRNNLPPVILVDFDAADGVELDFASMEVPIFIKVDHAHSRTREPDAVLKANSHTEARTLLHTLRSKYKKAVVQGFVPGRGVGVFLLRWNGCIQARFMHRRLHEMPHTGGASSLRESWWHDRIAADAEAKLALVDWQGVAMVEYRWDPTTDRFFLMEMNLRFWGSLHLALYAGVDFPKFLASCFFGERPNGLAMPSGAPYRLGIKCRNTIPFEIGYLVSLWRDKKVSLRRKLYSIYEALYLTLDPRVKNDLLFPGDRMLFFHRIWRFVRTGR